MMSTDHAGQLLRVNSGVTAGFTALAALTHLADGPFDVLFAAMCALLFAAGIGTFLLGFWNGVQRSRVDDVTLVGLLAVSTAFVQKTPRNRLWIANGLQILIALVAASVRPFTAQAFSVLVPMFGVGIAALWGSRHATFHPRDDPRTH
ncbi:MAG: hypothetical protein ACR2P0_16410 [Acidimicrobiales bacterium]